MKNTMKYRLFFLALGNERERPENMILQPISINKEPVLFDSLEEANAHLHANVHIYFDMDVVALPFWNIEKHSK